MEYIYTRPLIFTLEICISTVYLILAISYIVVSLAYVRFKSSLSVSQNETQPPQRGSPIAMTNVKTHHKPRQLRLPTSNHRREEGLCGICMYLKEPGNGKRNCLGFVFYLESTGFLQPCRIGDWLLATSSEN